MSKGSQLNDERKKKSIKHKLHLQCFGDLKPSISGDALLNQAATLIVLNDRTEKRILAGEESDSQFTARVNALNRVLKDLAKIKQDPLSGGLIDLEN